MENRVRKDVLIDWWASVMGLALALYSLATLKQPDLLRLITAIVGVGVFLFGSVRYGLRLRQERKKQKD